jgi:hypothetical protein
MRGKVIGALTLYGEVEPVEGMLPAILAAKRFGLIIADELSHICVVLSHSLRTEEPPLRNREPLNFTSRIIKLHANKHATFIQEVFFWSNAEGFLNCILKEAVKEPLVLVLGIQGIPFKMWFNVPRNWVWKA